MTRQVFSVAQVNRYVKQRLEADALLAGLFVGGEISNFTAHASGHMYFTLKDENAAISSVMFRGHAENLEFKPKSGIKVIAFGRLSIYEKTGQYQLYVEYLEPAGIGGKQLAFQQLKEKLDAEGLFLRKRPLPRFPKCVAVITSPSGAAVWDIIKTIRAKNRAVQIVIIPAIVQGETAAADLARAVSWANEWGGADLLIIGRGGGSVEDIWAFNEEILARAVFASKIPVISAVGHETDFTITDFVADYRAPTPTAAAETAVYDQAEVEQFIGILLDNLDRAVIDNLCEKYNAAKGLIHTLSRVSTMRLANEWQRLGHLEQLLEKVSPYAVFRRGFALVQDEDGRAIVSAAAVESGQEVRLTWADGSVSAIVK